MLDKIKSNMLLNKIGNEVIISIVMFMLGLFAKVIYEYFRNKKPARKFWKLSKQNNIHIITSNTPEEVRIEKNEYMSLGYSVQYLALSKIESFLNNMYKDLSVDIRMDCDFDENNYDDNIISIGGPINNSVSNEMLKSLNLPFEFDGYSLSEKGTDNIYEAKIEEDKIKEDYVLIVNARNPLNFEKRVVIISGCRASGSLIGAYQIINSNNLRKHLKSVDTNKNFAMIVKGKVISFSKVTNIEVVNIRNF